MIFFYPGLGTDAILAIALQKDFWPKYSPLVWEENEKRREGKDCSQKDDGDPSEVSF